MLYRAISILVDFNVFRRDRYQSLPSNGLFWVVLFTATPTSLADLERTILAGQVVL